MPYSLPMFLWKRSFIGLIVTLSLVLLFSDTLFAHGMSEEEKQSIIDGGNWSYLWLGATHMLSGYDHLAFVFGIIFFLTTFRDIAKYVTAFTVGHSVTLIYATFNAIQLNYFLIDAIIGLSVCYIAFANLDGFRKYLSINPPNMMAMIIGLGLIHGFGLSTRLQALPLSEDQLLMNIISFNIGIELGQISALVVMLLLIAAWRHTSFFQTFSVITNYGLIFLGGFLFLMQMHGYEHTANAEEFTASAVEATPTTQQTPTLIDSSLPWKDSITLTIPARGDKEYKLFVDKGDTFVYEWKTDGEPLFFDFHGEPADDTSGYFESFAKGTDSQASGSLKATFSGTHGWYWKNNTRDPVVITLKTRGDYRPKDTMQKATSPSENDGRAKTHESIF